MRLAFNVAWRSGFGEAEMDVSVLGQTLVDNVDGSRVPEFLVSPEVVRGVLFCGS